VVLSGDGGDELFGGYDRYAVEERERRLEPLFAPMRGPLAAIGRLAPAGMKGRGFLRHMSLSGFERYIDAVTLFRRDEQRELFHPEVLARQAGADPWREARARVSGGDGHWLSALQHFDIKAYLPLDILTKVDRMSMAHSIEARVPLLDHELIEFAATIPPELRLRGGVGKYVFKQALRGVLPAQTLDRPKRGFAVPLARWLRGPLSGFVRDLLLSEKARRRHVLNPDYVEKLLRRNRDGRELDLHLWTCISFELWARRFLDEPRRPAVAAARTPLVLGPLAVEMGCA
jgi:asparagine synthase (glutamine-hydrolysing)